MCLAGCWRYIFRHRTRSNCTGVERRRVVTGQRGPNVSARFAQPSPEVVPLGLLLAILLSDVVTDIQVVTRELFLRDEMLERLFCALDRMNCAQEIYSLGSIVRRPLRPQPLLLDI